MALFPDQNFNGYDPRDRNIQKKMEDFYRESRAINQAFWDEADIDTRFEAGDQQVFRSLYGNVPFQNNRAFNFNRIQRIINMVSGYQRRNRNSTIVVPVENADQETADQFSKVLAHCARKDNVYETISDAFHGALVTGMNLLQVWVDYRNDPVSGDIKVDNCSYNSFLIDPFFRKKDLSDCRAIWKRSHLSKQAVMSLLPEHADEIATLSTTQAQDGKFQYMPENYDLGAKYLMTYDEFYYRDYRKQKILIDTKTGESIEWKGTDNADLKAFMQLYPQVKVVEQEIPTVKLALVVQGRVFYDDINPLGTDKYPFVPVVGLYNPQLADYTMRIQGMVRNLRDPQFLYNLKKVIECDVLESVPTTGWVAKENALIDPEDLYKTGQGRSIMLKEEAQMTDIQPIPTPQIPQSFFQLSESLSREIQEISGVNEELLGSATDDKAGILSMLRQGAGLTTLQTYFDQLDLSQKLLGQLMIDIIQSNFAPGKIKRIIEDEPTPQFYNKAFGTYDAAVEEGFNTSTQRQMQFAQLLQLREAGVPVPDDVLLDAATVQNKKELTDAINQANQQKAQMEEMQLQAAIQEQQARTNLANARAVADQGLGIERVSRVEENRELAVERRAEAQKDRTQGLLNIVKTLQEMDDIEINQIQKLLALSGALLRSESYEGQALQNQVEQQQPQRAPLPQIGRQPGSGLETLAAMNT